MDSNFVDLLDIRPDVATFVATSELQKAGIEVEPYLCKDRNVRVHVTGRIDLADGSRIHMVRQSKNWLLTYQPAAEGAGCTTVGGIRFDSLDQSSRLSDQEDLNRFAERTRPATAQAHCLAGIQPVSSLQVTNDRWLPNDSGW